MVGGGEPSPIQPNVTFAPTVTLSRPTGGLLIISSPTHKQVQWYALTIIIASHNYVTRFWKMVSNHTFTVITAI